MPFLSSVSTYISSPKDSKGKLMTETRSRTGFIRFLVAIESVKGLHACRTARQFFEIPFNLQTQDHLELLFAAVRPSCGFNSNPTGRQFVACYKPLLMRNFVKNTNHRTGNCLPLDGKSLLEAVRADTVFKKSVPDETIDNAVARQYHLDGFTPVEHDRRT